MRLYGTLDSFYIYLAFVYIPIVVLFVYLALDIM